MKSRTTANFRQAFAELPEQVQKQTPESLTTTQSELNRMQLYFGRTLITALYHLYWLKQAQLQQFAYHASH